MALDENKFSHITVTTDGEDDEVVIQAGARPTTASQPEETPVADDGSHAVPHADKRSAEHVPKAQSTAKKKTDATSLKSTSKKAAKDDDYHETTLEDLSETKMSITQRVIFILLAVFLVAFVVYYIINFC